MHPNQQPHRAGGHPYGRPPPLHFPQPPPQHVGPPAMPVQVPMAFPPVLPGQLPLPPPPAAAAAAAGMVPRAPATALPMHVPRPPPMLPNLPPHARPPLPPPPGASYAPGYAPPLHTRLAATAPSAPAGPPASGASAAGLTPLALGFFPEDVAKMGKIFIGNISSGVTDEWIERLLVACGPIKEWKRMRGPDGSLKGFGFVTYADPMATVRALECLAGGEAEGAEAVVVPSLDGGEHKRLLLKLDDDAKKMLNRFKAARGNQPLDLEHDRMTRRRIQETLDTLRSHAGLPPLPANSLFADAYPPTALAPLGNDASSSTGSTLARESTPGAPPAGAGQNAAAPPANVFDLDAFVPKSVAAPAKLAKPLKPKPLLGSEPAAAAPRRRRWDQDASAQPLESAASNPAVISAATATDTMQAAGFVALTSRATPSAGVWAATKPSTGGAGAGSGARGSLTLGKPISRAGPGAAGNKLSAGPKKFGFGRPERSSPSGSAMGQGDEDGDGDEGGKKKSRLVLLAEQHHLADAHADGGGPNVDGMSDSSVLGYSVPWAQVSHESLDSQVAPRVAQLVDQFLGQADADLTEYFVQEIAHCGSAREVVLELEQVFGKEEASALVACVWRELIRAALG